MKIHVCDNCNSPCDELYNCLGFYVCKECAEDYDSKEVSQ